MKALIPLEVYQAFAKQTEFRDGKPYWTNHKLNTLNGKLAGSIITSGHRQLSMTINGKSCRVLAHRLHYFMAHNELPAMLDHINRIEDDNRIENLRPCTPSQNARNGKPSGASKFRGISFCKANSKWKAQCSVNGVNNYLGYFTLETEAARAYDNFCIENNLTFANLNFTDEVSL